MSVGDESDVELATRVASQAADALIELRSTSLGEDPWWFAERADEFAHHLIVDELRVARPDDAILSEEGSDDRSRLDHDRVWIVDPLDGSTGFAFGGAEWAVHVALTIAGEAGPSAVAAPGLGGCFATSPPVEADVPAASSPEPTVVVGRSRVAFDGRALADAMGVSIASCSSAGVKAVLVATGQVDAYVHGSPLWEWDLCAPAAVAQAAGLTVVDRHGDPMCFNKPHPVIDGVVIAPHELVEDLVAALKRR